MRVRFWGTRGSIATPGPSTLQFGGNTSCVELITDSCHRFILDCGTGARPLGIDLVDNVPTPMRATILLSHTHWDHIQGFPFFAPIFGNGNEITVCAPEGYGRSLAEVLAGQMEFTYFPVEMKELPAKITYRDFTEGEYEMEGARVLTHFMNHPAMTLGYRIEIDGVAVCYLCDHEPFSEVIWRADAKPGVIDSILHTGDRSHAEFMRDADLVIHDSQYTPEEYPEKRNWGHSTFEYVIELAAAAGVRRVALTHHEPTHADEDIAEIERRARETVRERGLQLDVFCAYEGCDVLVTPAGPKKSLHSDAHSRHTAVPHENAKILIIDDEAEVRMLAEAALEEYELFAAEDGVEGLQLVAVHQPNVIVLDLHMPKLDGLQVLKTLRTLDSTAHTPVLLLTAEDDEGTIRKMFDAGATDYLTKPFTVPQLLTRVRACLARATHKAASA